MNQSNAFHGNTINTPPTYMSMFWHMFCEYLISTMMKHTEYTTNEYTTMIHFFHKPITKYVHCSFIFVFKKIINNSRGKYKRNECLINVCKSDKDLS